MKSFKSSRRVIIIFLTLFIVVFCVLIARLEIKATNLQSRLDEHHKSLEQNKDILENLDSFSRKVKNNNISIDGDKVTISKDGTELRLDNGDIKLSVAPNIGFGYIAKEDRVFMYNKDTYIYIGKMIEKGGNTIYATEIRTRFQNSLNTIMVSSEGILIETRDQDKRSEIQLYKNSIRIRKDESVIKLDEDDLNIEISGDINITSKNGNVNIKGKKVKVNE